MLGREVATGWNEVGVVEAVFVSPSPEDNGFGRVRGEEISKRRAYLDLKLQVYEFTKRATDLFGSLSALIILSPLLVALYVLVRVTSRGPAIFCQNRLTVGGRIFPMYKFRTMRVDAEAASGPVWAENDDPRVTMIGKFLRRYRLDELPQLANVLCGDMSLIGPRPERPELIAKLEAEFPGFRKRLKVKGGITGLAQVSSGYASCMQSYSEKLTFDLAYIRYRSIWLDMKIAAKTVKVLLTGSGAR